MKLPDVTRHRLEYPIDMRRGLPSIEQIRLCEPMEKSFERLF